MPFWKNAHPNSVAKGKSIPHARVEGEFEAMLDQLAPSPQLIEIAAQLFRNLWDQKIASSMAHKKTMKAELSQIERKVESLPDKFVDSNNPIVTRRLEQGIEESERRRLLLEEKITRCGTPATPFESSFRTALDFLEKP